MVERLELGVAIIVAEIFLLIPKIEFIMQLN